MRRKETTVYALADMQDIAAFIAQDDIDAAERYYRSAMTTFRELPDMLTPVRASEQLPETVRKISVAGFAGYTLHIAILEDAIYLLSAFRPGLPDAYRAAQTRFALDHRHD